MLITNFDYGVLISCKRLAAEENFRSCLTRREELLGGGGVPLLSVWRVVTVAA